MGKVTKKSNTNVAVAPAKAPPSKPITKGKRDAEVKIEKPNPKKQKKDSGLEQAEDKEVDEKTQKNMDICSAEESPGSEEELKEPADKIVPEQKGAQLAENEQQSDSSEEVSGSEDEDEEIPDADGETKVAPSNSAKNEEANEEQSESSSEEGSSDDDETVEKAVPKAPVTTEKAKSSPEEGSSEEGSSEEDVEASSDEDVATKSAPSKSTTSAAKNEMETDDDSEDDDSSGSEEEEPNSKINPQTPATPKAEAQESKTVFIGNLPWSIGEDDIKKFFKGIGEVKEVRLAKQPNGRLKGFGHVDFTTCESAVKALELTGKELGGRQVKVDRALEKIAYTPDSGKQNNSEKQGKCGGTTVYVKGFDKNNSEDEIRSALENHFGSCGEIKDTRIPTEQGSVKGIAYIEFADSDAANKALKLNDSKIGSDTLHVEEAKPRGDSGGGRSGGRGGRGGGGRSGGRGGGGRRGGRGRK